MSIDAEWKRFLTYMEYQVRPQCPPQRATLSGGPFEWLQSISGKVFGEKVGPLIAQFFLEDEYRSRANSDHDFIFRGMKVELKTSVEHSTPGVYLFEQIRPRQDWDCLLCIGIASESLSFFVFPKPYIKSGIQRWSKGKSSPIEVQHGGAKGRERSTKRDTYWIWTKPKWNKELRRFRSSFGPRGWQGIPLKQALRRCAYASRSIVIESPVRHIEEKRRKSPMQ